MLWSFSLASVKVSEVQATVCVRLCPGLDPLFHCRSLIIIKTAERCSSMRLRRRLGSAGALRPLAPHKSTAAPTPNRISGRVLLSKNHYCSGGKFGPVCWVAGGSFVTVWDYWMLSVLHEYYKKVFCSTVVLHAFTFWLSVPQMVVFREDELEQNQEHQTIVGSYKLCGVFGECYF